MAPLDPMLLLILCQCIQIVLDTLTAGLVIAYKPYGLALHLEQPDSRGVCNAQVPCCIDWQCSIYWDRAYLLIDDMFSIISTVFVGVAVTLPDVSVERWVLLF